MMRRILVKLLCLLIIISIVGCIAGPDVTALASQVRGNGCSYDSSCEWHWSWWQRLATRNPEYTCRMRAASCLGKHCSKATPVIPELIAARSEMPERFDTGDGVLKYSACIDAAIAEIKGQERLNSLGTMDCGF